jgi:hypothetical protein
MEYFLSTLTTGNPPEVKLTAEKYTRIESAWDVLRAALEIETKYEIVIVNYMEFEKQMLDATVSNMVRMPSARYSDFFEVRLGLNVRLINLLTAVRLYLDQVVQDAPKCVPRIESAKDKVGVFRNKEWDENKEYRFMDALRNYVQHKGLPIHIFAAGSEWKTLKDDEFLEIYIELYAKRSELEKDNFFKTGKNKIVLEEQDENIDLKETTRKYLESVSNIHVSVREMIDDLVKDSRVVVEDAFSRYNKKYNKKYKKDSSFVFLTKRSNERIKSRTPLVLDLDNIRVELQKRNKKLINLRKRYPSGQIRARK